MKTDKGREAYSEIVEGRNGRPSLLVRMERAEMSIAALTRVVQWLAYVATAVLVAVLLACGKMVFESLKGGQ